MADSRWSEVERVVLHVISAYFPCFSISIVVFHENVRGAVVPTCSTCGVTNASTLAATRINLGRVMVMLLMVLAELISVPNGFAVERSGLGWLEAI